MLFPASVGSWASGLGGPCLGHLGPHRRCCHHHRHRLWPSWRRRHEPHLSLSFHSLASTLRCFSEGVHEGVHEFNLFVELILHAPNGARQRVDLGC